MMARRLTASDPTAVEQAVAALRRGELVGLPTETVYGLAADAGNPDAVARIFAAKGRPSFNPLISHVASTDLAAREGVLDERALSLADVFWPGPLTLVVPFAGQAHGPASESGQASEIGQAHVPHDVGSKSGQAHNLASESGQAHGSDIGQAHVQHDVGQARTCDLARAGLATIALRVPDHPIARAVLAAHAGPVSAPSANPSGRLSPTRADDVLRELGDRVALVIDGGACPAGIE